MTTVHAAMLDQIKSGQGFIAALDQSGGSTPKALKGYGIEADAFSNDEEMFGLIHDMRSRIVTAPCFNGDKVIGAILFERTMDGEAGGKPVPALLWERGLFIDLIAFHALIQQGMHRCDNIGAAAIVEGDTQRDLLIITRQIKGCLRLALQ